MKALVGAFNQEKALVGAFSVIVKTGCGTDGALHSTTYDAGAGGWAEQEHELLAADELHRHRRHTPQQLPAALHHGSVQ